MYEFSNFAPQGWQCPICKRVYSPTYPWCIFCGGSSVTTTTTTTTSSDWWNEYQKELDKINENIEHMGTSTSYKIKPNQHITAK